MNAILHDVKSEKRCCTCANQLLSMLMDLSRESIRLWLEGVLSQTGETATGLARKANVAQSTVTRFLNDPDGPLLSTRTINKLAAAAGITPPGLPGGAGPAAAGGFGEAEATLVPQNQEFPAHLRAALEVLTRGRKSADVWLLKTRALLHAGYMPGDLVVVDLGRTPDAGDIVGAQHYTWSKGTAETIFRIYEPPYLVAASDDPELRRPLVVDGERVIIKGVVTESIRYR